MRRKLGAYLGVKTHRRNPKGVKVIRKSYLLAHLSKASASGRNHRCCKKNLRKWND